MSCVLSEKVKPGEAKEFGTSWSARQGNSFGFAGGGEGVSGGVQEVSAATSVWSLHYILLQPTLDCGRQHFCRVRKWPSTRLPDITPKPGIIAPSLKPPNNAYIHWDVFEFSFSLSRACPILSLCPDLQQRQHSCPCGTVPGPFPAHSWTRASSLCKEVECVFLEGTQRRQ